MRILIFVIISSLSYQCFANESDLTVKHYQSHYRYRFGLNLLELALSKLKKPYKIETSKADVNEARGQHMVILGQLDLQFLSTNTEREKLMIPVKIPVYRGLLGLRLLLVNKGREGGLKIKNIEDLRKYMGGHGTHWGDLSVYPANNLKVEKNVHYEGLFKQLKAGRFDYIHRGVNEIWDELDQHKNELEIEDGVMLFYPHPVYFFVSKTRPQLAKDLKEGLELALKDGSFQRLFTKTYSQSIKKASLNNRSLIILKNPVVPEGSPPIDTDWWSPKRYKNVLKSP